MWKNCAWDHAQKKNGKKERNTSSSSRFLSARAFPSIAHHRRRDRWRWYKPIKYTLVSHLFGYFVSIERRRNNNKKVKVERRKRAVVCAVVDDSPRRNGAGWWKGKKGKNGWIHARVMLLSPVFSRCFPTIQLVSYLWRSLWPCSFFFFLRSFHSLQHLFSFHKFLLMPVICLVS